MPNARLLRLLAALLLGSLALTAAGASRPAPPMLNLTAGAVGVADSLQEPTRFGLEYRFRDRTRFRLIPAIGIAGAVNGARFIYADLRYDWWITDRLAVIPSFGPGIFDDGRGLELGQELEFRSGLELAYRFHREYRLGLALFHLSNGGLADENPGTEALVASLCIPLGRPRQRAP